MQLSQARALREERAKLIKNAQALNDKGGKLSAADQRTFDRMMEDADLLQARIDKLENPDADYQQRGGRLLPRMPDAGNQSMECWLTPAASRPVLHQG